MRATEHHVRYVGGALSSEDVVLDDERTRACGRRSTTSGTPAAPWAPKTWCLTTKEQGFAESEAPRPVRRRRLALRPRPTPPPKKDRRTVGPPNFPNFPNLLNLSGIPKYSARPSIGFTQVPPTSLSGFSWSSSWIAASSGFLHVPARSGRSAADPWSRTGSNNSCC